MFWQLQGAFDAGAYSFFGDMAPLDEGLGGALEVGSNLPRLLSAFFADGLTSCSPQLSMLPCC
jgi:hypothetical protein